MKTVANGKVVVIHRGEGVSDYFRDLIWKWFGHNINVKAVHYGALADEFEYKQKADLVICRESVNGHARLILSQWPYETHLVCLGKPKEKGDHIDFVPTLEEWDHKQFKFLPR